MKVLDSLYCNIDLISDDSELIALYRLTNSWIKEYIENDREYNRLETLRSYNYEIISRISSSEIREKLMAKVSCNMGGKSSKWIGIIYRNAYGSTRGKYR